MNEINGGRIKPAGSRKGGEVGEGGGGGRNCMKVGIILREKN